MRCVLVTTSEPFIDRCIGPSRRVAGFIKLIRTGSRLSADCFRKGDQALAHVNPDLQLFVHDGFSFSVAPALTSCRVGGRLTIVPSGDWS